MNCGPQPSLRKRCNVLAERPRRRAASCSRCSITKRSSFGFCRLLPGHGCQSVVNGNFSFDSYHAIGPCQVNRYLSTSQNHTIMCVSGSAKQHNYVCFRLDDRRVGQKWQRNRGITVLITAIILKNSKNAHLIWTLCRSLAARIARRRRWTATPLSRYRIVKWPTMTPTQLTSTKAQSPRSFVSIRRGPRRGDDQAAAA